MLLFVLVFGVVVVFVVVAVGFVTPVVASASMLLVANCCSDTSEVPVPVPVLVVSVVPVVVVFELPLPLTPPLLLEPPPELPPYDVPDDPPLLPPVLLFPLLSIFTVGFVLLS